MPDAGPFFVRSDILTFTEAGTRSLRVNILPKKFFRRYVLKGVRPP